MVDFLICYRYYRVMVLASGYGMNDIKKGFIDKYYNSDVAAYEQNMTLHDPEADMAYLRYGKDSTLHWHDIALQAKCNPEYEEIALAYVRYVLGYLPSQHAYMPSLAFLQTLVESYQAGKISSETFGQEFFSHVKQIRNKDMKNGGWVQHKIYSEADHHRYDTYLSLYKQSTRERLSRLLGYEPSLAYSLDAEIFLRLIFQEDYFYTDMPFCNADYIAATVVKYREAFLQKGEAAADASDLFGRSFEEFIIFLTS